MSNMKKVVLITSVVLLLCLIGAGITLGIYYARGNDLSSFWNIFENYKIELNETVALPLEGVSDILVDCSSGDIVVTDAKEARVELRGNLVAREAKEKYLSVSVEDGKLSVIFDFNHGSFPDVIMADIDLTVYLPKDLGLNLQVFSSFGNLTTENMQFGDVAVSHASGDIFISGCTGGTLDINVSSGNTHIRNAGFSDIGVVCQSGDIDVSDTGANLSVRNTSGKVEVSDVYGLLKIVNTSGDITVDLSKTDFGAMDLSVTSGNVRVFLPKEAAFNLTAKATSGNIDIDFPIKDSGNHSTFTGKEVAGVCNGGGKEISIDSLSGDIKLKQN
ncbi:MAG: DUF4097 family beta strand repeat-containing protein [Christensenellales bacterium]